MRKYIYNSYCEYEYCYVTDNPVKFQYSVDIPEDKLKWIEAINKQKEEVQEYLYRLQEESIMPPQLLSLDELLKEQGF
jgi:hypothetical protein